MSEINNFYFEMKFLLVNIVLLADLLYINSEEFACGNHEVYDECGTKCPKKCTTLDIRIKCVSDCEVGCLCEDGYVRHEKIGECIKPEECPTCGKNETYKSGGIDCQTCSNHKQVFCAAVQEYRCFCLPGYVRDDVSGICISPEDCPQERCQGPNEEKVQCFYGPCEKTCQNCNETLQCPQVCFNSGCTCTQGYIRNTITGQCVSPEECPYY